MTERVQRGIVSARDGDGRECRREDEGNKLANAITIILAREQKAEEQRRLRRLQVRKNICLAIAAVVLFSIHTGNDMINAFADTFQISGGIWERETQGEKEIIQSSVQDRILNSAQGREEEDGQEKVARPSPRYTSIQVENGDSLWSIASRYADRSPMDIQGYVEELKRINQLKGDTIHTGNYLMVVYYQ